MLEYPIPTETELSRYLAGDISPEDRERVDVWIAQSEENRAYVDALRDVWTRAGEQPFDERTDEVWQSLSGRLGLRDEAPSATEIPLRVVRHSPPQGLRQIAGVSRRSWIPILSLGFAAAAALVFVFRREMPTHDAPVVAPKYREYSTRNAQRAEVRLADGTRVVIAPASRLRVPEDYGVSSRSLTLEGEAYFDVVHNDAKPFTVRTPNTTTKDIGTAFVITDYAGDRTADVLVEQGEVAMLSPKDSTASTLQVLSRGDLARVTADGRVSRSRVTNLERRLAWVRGGLAFDNVPLSDAIRSIGRWYDMDIRLSTTSLRDVRLSATIGKEAPDDVLRLVALALDLKFERETQAGRASRVVTFYPKRPQQ